jgi:hypothetical protein
MDESKVGERLLGIDGIDIEQIIENIKLNRFNLRYMDKLKNLCIILSKG